MKREVQGSTLITYNRLTQNLFFYSHTGNTEFTESKRFALATMRCVITRMATQALRA